MTKTEMQAQALSNARNGQSLANYEPIINGFIAKGIAEEDITPRVNTFTYNAWIALGRQVRKGEKGVKVCTWVPVGAKIDTDTGETKGAFRRPKTTTVFHVSQTDLIVTGVRP